MEFLVNEIIISIDLLLRECNAHFSKKNMAKNEDLYDRACVKLCQLYAYWTWCSSPSTNSAGTSQ